MTDKVYFPPKCSYSAEGVHIVTDGSVKGKVSGTMMGAILGVSPWSTPFQVACELLGLGREDISSKPSVKTGKYLESKIIEYAGGAYPEKGIFVPAESIYAKREGDHASWLSDFESDIFSGHVDGIVMDDAGDNFILEVKTSKNLDAWVKGVPPYYFWQVALYNHFITKKDHAYVVLGIVNDNTYRDPDSWVANPGNVMLFDMPIDEKTVDAGLKTISDWYSEFIEKGITPDYDLTNAGDVELWSHLVSLTADIGTIQGLIDEYQNLEARIAQSEESQKGMYDARDSLKNQIKSYMDAKCLSTLDSKTGEYCASVTTSTRSRIDGKLMLAAGIDPKPFTAETVTKTFTVKSVMKKEGD